MGGLFSRWIEFYKIQTDFFVTPCVRIKFYIFCHKCVLKRREEGKEEKMKRNYDVKCTEYVEGNLI